MQTKYYCNCGAQKILKVVKIATGFNMFTNVNYTYVQETRFEPIMYVLNSDERISEVVCSECGLLYSLDSIGRNL